MCVSSVGRISPPPLSTLPRQVPQEPPPPHADGTKTWASASACNNVHPRSCSISFFPLMLIFTDPSGIIFLRANNKIPTSNQMITRKMMVADMMVKMFIV